MKFEYENDWLIFEHGDVKTSKDLDALNRLLEQMMHVYGCEAWRPAEGILECMAGFKYIGAAVKVDQSNTPQYILLGKNIRDEIVLPKVKTFGRNNA